MSEYWPAWAREWLDVIVPVAQVLLIVAVAWLLQQLARRLIRRLGRHNLPAEALTVVRRASGFLIYAAAVLLVLERLGVSAGVLWGAFTGFAAVAAVAFFAVWSVLSNIFCTILIFTTRPFRLYERIELLENGEKPGLKGRVTDINLIYTTLQEENGSDASNATTLQIPNSLFFQRVVRRWTGSAMRPLEESTSTNDG
ncbi:small-conductance mechanosensitive channel [Povalibacter uvarum]|uniref:Small-conductance mechanosensitive channel n=1 Tax=Povalibacter uvarum TaxID=732238 RepID=A0A841HRQ6_9GAMM|nr:mechanosensitive ion channel family protein [Povalibacter uvarum]MBB6094758.1 small-conductance mechanosensitive channel [Povalibacter uvarum]